MNYSVNYTVPHTSPASKKLAEELSRFSGCPVCGGKTVVSSRVRVEHEPSCARLRWLMSRYPALYGQY